MKGLDQTVWHKFGTILRHTNQMMQNGILSLCRYYPYSIYMPILYYYELIELNGLWPIIYGSNRLA